MEPRMNTKHITVHSVNDASKKKQFMQTEKCVSYYILILETDPNDVEK